MTSDKVKFVILNLRWEAFTTVCKFRLYNALYWKLQNARNLTFILFPYLSSHASALPPPAYGRSLLPGASVGTRNYSNIYLATKFNHRCFRHTYCDGNLRLAYKVGDAAVITGEGTTSLKAGFVSHNTQRKCGDIHKMAHRGSVVIFTEYTQYKSMKHKLSSR